jgi:hypothetical protein
MNYGGDKPLEGTFPDPKSLHLLIASLPFDVEIEFNPDDPEVTFELRGGSTSGDKKIDKVRRLGLFEGMTNWDVCCQC